MTLNDLERRNSPYFAFFSLNLIDFQADHITVVEDRPIISVKYCLSVPLFHFWPKLLPGFINLGIVNLRLVVYPEFIPGTTFCVLSTL